MHLWCLLDDAHAESPPNQGVSELQRCPSLDAAWQSSAPRVASHKNLSIIQAFCSGALFFSKFGVGGGIGSYLSRWYMGRNLVFQGTGVNTTQFSSHCVPNTIFCDLVCQSRTCMRCLSNLLKTRVDSVVSFPHAGNTGRLCSIKCDVVSGAEHVHVCRTCDSWVTLLCKKEGDMWPAPLIPLILVVVLFSLGR